MSDTFVYFIIDDLREVSKHLKRYCHIWFCNNIYECPKDHFFCNLKLNLKTSIAWEISKILDGLISEFEKNGEYNELLDYIQKTYIKLRTHRRVVYYHHRKLYKIISYAMEVVDSLKKEVSNNSLQDGLIKFGDSVWRTY